MENGKKTTGVQCRIITCVSPCECQHADRHARLLYSRAHTHTQTQTAIRARMEGNVHLQVIPTQARHTVVLCVPQSYSVAAI